MNYGTTDGVLKPLDKVLLPDPRFKFMAMESETEIRPFRLADMHERLNLSTLDPKVPADVRRQFETARNLMLYTWFVFEFQTVAEQQAYGALEMALRARFPGTMRRMRKRRREAIVPETLGPLLRMAVDAGLIVPEKLPAWERVQARQKCEQENSGTPLSAKQWLDHLLVAIPDFRNDLAHGSTRLYLSASLSQLELCADLINALFANG